MAQFPAVCKMTESDARKMLAASVQLGSVNVDACMEPYVYKRRADGVNIINMESTWEKIILAARVIAGIENPKDIVVVSARPYGQRAILKLAKYLGVQAIAGRYTPGTFTNQIQKRFVEPRLLIVTDPRTDAQAIREASFCNLPVIALCGTDCPLYNVDIAIPCNNKGRMSVGLVYWFLTREVLRIKNEIKREEEWDVMPDLFFYRDPDTKDKKDEQPVDLLIANDAAAEAEAAQAEAAPAEVAAPAATLGDFAAGAAPANVDWAATSASTATAASNAWEASANAEVKA